jgi:hypothetical protein
MLRRFAKRLLWVFLTLVAIVAWIALLDIFAEVTRPNVYQLWGNEGYVWLYYRLWWLAPAVLALLAALRGLPSELAAAVLFGFLVAPVCWGKPDMLTMMVAGHAGVPYPHCVWMGDRLGAALLVSAPPVAGLLGFLLRRRKIGSAVGGRPHGAFLDGRERRRFPNTSPGGAPDDPHGR